MADMTKMLYDLLDNDETGIRYSLKQKQHPHFAGSSLCTQAGEPAPLILSAKGENSWRENRPSE